MEVVAAPAALVLGRATVLPLLLGPAPLRLGQAGGAVEALGGGHLGTDSPRLSAGQPAGLRDARRGEDCSEQQPEGPLEGEALHCGAERLAPHGGIRSSASVWGGRSP